jgi:nicotinamidase-related amidase
MRYHHMTPVFVFIDLQEDYFRQAPLADRRASIVDAVNELARFAREHAHPVVWVRAEIEPDLSDALLSLKEVGIRNANSGKGGTALLAELEVVDGDHEIVKKRYSAFFGTELQSLLSSLSCTHVVIAGVNSHACVRSSAVDAYQLDYRVLLADDAIASYDAEYHRESMRYLAQSIGRVVSNGEICEYFGAR